MNKNEFKDDIKNALQDLKDDYKTYEYKCNENLQDLQNDKTSNLKKYFSKSELEKMGISNNFNTANDENAFRYAVFKLFFPHIAGAVIGCAIGRMFELGLIGYVIMGVIFAFLVGVHKSTYDDQITLKYAVIKNIVLITIEIIFILLIFGIGGIIYMMG